MSELINSFAEWIRSFGIPDYLVIFIISLFPILELRGGLIAAAVLKLKLIPSFIVCFVGNILPIPFILLFIKKIFKWMKNWKPTYKLAVYFEKKGEKNAKEAESKSFFGKLIFLFLFVAIPLPGTGGWTGALVASFMNLKLKYSIPVILVGVLTAGFIMSIICYALPELATQWFGFSF
ncbi:MAG: small multi-drug export protein [Acutalibacteraceae bacterium]|nr:small multi-drug export protein [Acutalibacteraceae bacterium]